VRTRASGHCRSFTSATESAEEKILCRSWRRANGLAPTAFSETASRVRRAKFADARAELNKKGTHLHPQWAEDVGSLTAASPMFILCLRRLTEKNFTGLHRRAALFSRIQARPTKSTKMGIHGSSNDADLPGKTGKVPKRKPAARKSAAATSVGVQYPECRALYARRFLRGRFRSTC